MPFTLRLTYIYECQIILHSYMLMLQLHAYFHIHLNQSSIETPPPPCTLQGRKLTLLRRTQFPCWNHTLYSDPSSICWAFADNLCVK